MSSGQDHTRGAIAVRTEVIEAHAISASYHTDAMLREFAAGPPINGLEHVRLSSARRELQKAIDNLGFMIRVGAISGQPSLDALPNSPEPQP